RNKEFYNAYMNGTLDIYAFLDFQLKPLSRHDMNELSTWHEQFMSRKILPMISERARVEVSRAVGSADFVALITATNSFVTAPIAQELGITHLIATEPEMKNGVYTGKVKGTPCFREGKVTRLHQWLAEQGLSWGDIHSSRFYSDSHNDLPLLQMVSEPVAVDPDEVLRAHAGLNQWPIVSLR
ncbi:MAG: HAD-IB family hydrolase, partial [Pseudomonadota bacterium]|nr:HAD-IB family hydrolase [Pseudomonadota bacterium]